MVRAANTGISAIIDPYGRVVAQLGLNVKGILDGELPQALPPTPFARWERLIEIAALALALGGWLACRVHWLR